MEQNKKQMRVFISSTFQDLNSERDYLMKQVFPELKEIARSRGVDFIALDLRWGITSEDTKNGKVLEICLREIDNSHPYFIGIIGDRYGWCPSESDYINNDNLCKSYNKIGKYINNQLSITEIEFMYAALDSRKKRKAAFYIKDYDIYDTKSSQYNEKLKKFRRKIEQNKRYPVNKFNTKEQLGKLIRNFILTELDKLYPKSVVIDEYQELKKTQQRYLKQMSENYIPNVNNLRLLNKIVSGKLSKKDSDIKGLVNISDSPGSGRSSLLAYWITEQLKTNNINIVYYFMSPGAEKQDSKAIASYIIHQIEELYQISKEDFICKGEDYARTVQTLEELKFQYPQEWLDYFYKMRMMGMVIQRRKPLAIVIDGMLHLPAEEWGVLLGMVCLSEKYYYYIVTEDNFYGINIFSGNVLKVNPLTIKQRKQITISYLSKYGKKLSNNQLHLVSHGLLTQKPKLLKILLDELVLYGSYEGLDNFIDYYLSAPDEQAFFNCLYDRYEADYGEHFVRDVVSILKILEGDCMSEDELVEITGTSLYNWSCFFCGARNQFEVVDGLIRMAPSYDKDVIKERYITNEVIEVNYRRRIADYFKTKDYMHVDRYCRILAKQLRELEDKKTFFQFLSVLPVYRMLRKADQNELRGYWDYVQWNEHCPITEHSPYILYQQLLDNDASADDFLDMADFIRQTEYSDNTHIYCLYEAEKRYEGQKGKKDKRYRALRDLGRYIADDKEAIDALQKALTVIADYPKSYDYRRIDCYAEIGIHYENLSFYNQAIEYIEKAIELLTEENEPYANFKHAKDKLLLKLSEDYLTIQQYEDSLKYCKLTLKYIQLHDGEKYYYTPTLVDLYIRICTNALHLGMNAECRKNAGKAISFIDSDKEHDYSNQLQTCFEYIGVTYYNQGDYEKALDFYFKALAIREKVLGTEHPDTAISYNNIGVAYDRLGDYEKALDYYFKALAICEKVLGLEHPNTKTAQENIDTVKQKMK